jgi:hypothetical protein
MLDNPTTQEILERISRHCPQAMYVYLHCFNRADHEGKIVFTKEMVDVDLSENWYWFRDHIKALARENILEWHPENDQITVIMGDLDG